mmetsp:Transcript_45782/g.114763  ORF Transcript_45782/g.114763 Transcript_45782/m.114763 type:complete len:337 (-) Transcript_45782:176-1186(-)
MSLAASSPQLWTAPGAVQGLSATYMAAHASACEAPRAPQDQPPQQAFSQGPHLAPAAAASAGFPATAQALNPLAASHGSLLQSLLMQGAGGFLGQGAQPPPGVPGAGAPAPTMEQQAFLLQLLAAQQQVLAAQAGQLDAVSGMAAMAQGAPLAAPLQGLGRPGDEMGQTNASAHFASVQAAGEAARPLHRQPSASALHQVFSAAEGVNGAPGGRLELVFPRRGRKSGELDKKVQDPVLITFEVMQRLFHLPLTEAARQLGLSPTAIKGACRRLGIKKWPFRMVMAKSHRRAPRKPSPVKEPASGLSLLSAAAEVELNANSSPEHSTPAASPPGVSE